MRRADRLAGLVTLVNALGATTVRLRGLPEVVTSRYTEPSGTADGVVLLGPVTELSGRLDAADLADDALAVLLSPGRAIPEVPHGWTHLASYTCDPELASPTHLVRRDLAGTRRWYADSVRPAWSPRSDVAARLFALPVLGALGTPGTATVIARGARTSARAPWTPDHGPALPAVVHLGGGPSAGRAVLTCADDTGHPVVHVRLTEPGDAATGEQEQRLLAALVDEPALSGTVPTPLGTSRGSGWAASALSHLDGASLERRWRTAPSARQAARRAADLEAAATWLTTLARSTGVTGPGPSEPPTDPSTEPAHLAATLAHGAALVAAREVVVHGDLWPGNLLRRGTGPVRVVDWEGAHFGHPLHDALTLLLTSRAGAEPLRDRALQALTGPDAASSRALLDAVLAAGPAAHLTSPQDVEALVLSALDGLGTRPGPGGVTGPERREEAAQAAQAVHDAWVATGSPWRRDGTGPPVRVLHVLDSFSFGGAENLVAELARHAPPHWELRAASLAPEGQGRDQMLDRLAAAGLRPVHLGVRRLLDGRGVLRLSRVLRDLDVDVVHAHLGYSATLVPPAARAAGLPVVATLHLDPSDLPLGERVKERLSVRVPARLGRLLLLSTAAFEGYAERHGPATDSWLLVPNGVDVEEFAPRPPGTRRGSLPGITDDTFVWAVVAALREPKGHLDLFAALAQVLPAYPDTHLLVVGDGPFRATLEEAVAASGLERQVTFLGRRDDVAELLGRVDAVVSASHTEALPTSLVEALACGLPVVATDVGGTRDVVVDGVTGLLVPAHDPTALSAAMTATMADPRAASARAVDGRSHVVDRFSMSRWVARLDGIYAEVRSETAARRPRRQQPRPTRK